MSCKKPKAIPIRNHISLAAGRVLRRRWQL